MGLTRFRGHLKKGGYDAKYGPANRCETGAPAVPEEFKGGAVRLVLDESRTVGSVARELDLTASALAQLVRHEEAERSKGRTGLTREEREELVQLRKENRELRMEREVLKKATAFFAKLQA